MSVQRRSRLEPESQLLDRMRTLVDNSLTVTGRTERNPPHRMIEMMCSQCGREFWRRANDIQNGNTRCRCHRRSSWRWNRDPRVKQLGQRYHAIEQRCAATGPTVTRHGARGIENRFQSRDHFISWVLANLSREDYSGLEFDRIDGDGHYEPENLRLVTPREQSMNRRDNVYVPYMGQQVVREHLWHLIKHDHPDFPLKPDAVRAAIQRGKAAEEIVNDPHPRASTTFSTPDLAIVSLYRD